MLHALPAPPTSGASPRNAASNAVTLGMPQLSRNGLSENWLLKEAGHRHWLMLADTFGLPVPAFRDRDGATLYATFTGLRLSGGALDRVAEHDRLHFAGRIARVSRTQYRSVQTVTADGRPVATLELLSIFLRRAVACDNRSVLRALPHPCPPMLADAGPDSSLARLCQGFRRKDWLEHRGFRRADRQEIAGVAIDPCPHGDFNGAGFLYFASFQSILDRAEWALFRNVSAHAVTIDRDLFYHGNINPGDRLTVRLCGQRRDGTASLSHWFEILRDSDGARIADGFTTRRLVSSAEAEPDMGSMGNVDGALRPA